MFDSRSQKYIEVVSELLLLAISILLQQYLPYYSEDSMAENIEMFAFSSLSILILLNLIFMIYSIVKNILNKRRLKKIKKANEN